MMQALFIIFLVAATSVSAQTVHLQYSLENWAVRGVSPTPIQEVPGYGVLVLDVADVPPGPGGCPRRPEWYTVPDAATVVLRTPLVLFQCQEVRSAQDVRRVVVEEVEPLSRDYARVLAFGYTVVSAIAVRCPSENSTQACIDARSSATALAMALPNLAQLQNISEQLSVLLEEANALISAQGW